MLWTGIKSIVNLKAKHQLSHISHSNSNGSQVTDPVEMANLFNNYFVNVGSNIDKEIPRTKKSPLDYLKKRMSNSLLLSPVTPQKTEIIIQSLNVRKAIGPYSIPVFPLKILSRHIAQPLSSIINLSFESAIFSDKLKAGKVVPLHKRTVVTTHPISISNCMFFRAIWDK